MSKILLYCNEDKIVLFIVKVINLLNISIKEMMS